ncbi:MAG: CPBP family intramembrane metalloprotease [Chloroflexi bacterium]|nr:CPBP family intramembrane metalloprotease [Chloroflexota bacterium]
MLRKLWLWVWGGEPPVFPREATWVTIFSTAFMLMDEYNILRNLGLPLDEATESLVLYLIFPLLTLPWLGRSPREYGLTLGRWREALPLVGLTWVVAAGVEAASVYLDPSVRAYYRPLWSATYPWWVLTDLIGWEFIFRGYLLFAYARAFGVGAAMWLQMVPFALMHVGKPAAETFSTLFGGVWFAILAWRGRSVLYPILAHWFIGWFVAFIAVVLAGAV